METIELKASIRENSGKGPSRRYRMEGLVPAVVYSKGDSSVHLTVSEADMQKIIRSKKDKHFIKLVIDGEKQMEKISMLKELQYEPMSRHLYHADFYEIIMDHRLTVDIPLNFIGTPVGVVNGGELLHSKRDLKISCLPADMPDYIDVALAGLDIGDSLKVKDLVLPEGVAAVDHGDVGIVAVVAVKAAIVAPTETAAGEGAAPAEAAAKPAATDKGKTK
ncbi:MAG: 50S ribosomal protein L25 [Syntrophobacterales bacterium]|nr:50S ribosomal protein L25 [Syntrophobacterales bacterium]